MTVTFKRNGNITLNGNIVGVWESKKVKNDEIADVYYHAYLITGEHLSAWNPAEMKLRIRDKFNKLYNAKKTLSKEQQFINTENAKKEEAL